ncbi:hypothetical protein [Novosphingobium sp.]|uniref:hypothetical protein n=1 Tax=Novosphingobium sp. TaxID=1874826 RepID=UPI003D114A17
MSTLILLPFGVFFVCCILQFWYLGKVRDTLIERHPDTFLSVEKSSIFPMQGLYKFARGGRYKDLNDVLLNRHVRNLKRLMIVAYAAWGVYAISLFTMPFSGPQLPLALANGSYVNECCGRLTLKNGRMIVGVEEVSYVVESDKEGPYVLPTFYVGAASGGYVVRRDGQPLKLRLDNEAHPTTVELMDDTGGSIFSFHRLNGS